MSHTVLHCWVGQTIRDNKYEKIKMRDCDSEMRCRHKSGGQHSAEKKKDGTELREKRETFCTDWENMEEGWSFPSLVD